MFVPPLTIACTMHGSRAICSGPTLVGQHNEEDACARPFRDSQLCAQTPIPCGCFSSWVQNLILAHPEIWLRIKFYVCCPFPRYLSQKRAGQTKFGWESNFSCFIYVAVFCRKSRKKDQTLTLNQKCFSQDPWPRLPESFKELSTITFLAFSHAKLDTQHPGRPASASRVPQQAWKHWFWKTANINIVRNRLQQRLFEQWPNEYGCHRCEKAESDNESARGGRKTGFWSTPENFEKMII